MSDIREEVKTSTPALTVPPLADEKAVLARRHQVIGMLSTSIQGGADQPYLAEIKELGEHDPDIKAFQRSALPPSADPNVGSITLTAYWGNMAAMMISFLKNYPDKSNASPGKRKAIKAAETLLKISLKGMSIEREIEKFSMEFQFWEVAKLQKANKVKGQSELVTNSDTVWNHLYSKPEGLTRGTEEMATQILYLSKEMEQNSHNLGQDKAPKSGIFGMSASKSTHIPDVDYDPVHIDFLEHYFLPAIKWMAHVKSPSPLVQDGATLHFRIKRVGTDKHLSGGVKERKQRAQDTIHALETELPKLKAKNPITRPWTRGLFSRRAITHTPPPPIEPPAPPSPPSPVVHAPAALTSPSPAPSPTVPASDETIQPSNSFRKGLVFLHWLAWAITIGCITTAFLCATRIFPDFTTLGPFANTMLLSAAAFLSGAIPIYFADEEQGLKSFYMLSWLAIASFIGLAFSAATGIIPDLIKLGPFPGTIAFMSLAFLAGVVCIAFTDMKQGKGAYLLRWVGVTAFIAFASLSFIDNNLSLQTLIPGALAIVGALWFAGFAARDYERLVVKKNVSDFSISSSSHGAQSQRLVPPSPAPVPTTPHHEHKASSFRPLPTPTPRRETPEQKAIFEIMRDVEQKLNGNEKWTRIEHCGESQSKTLETIRQALGKLNEPVLRNKKAAIVNIICNEVTLAFYDAGMFSGPGIYLETYGVAARAVGFFTDKKDKTKTLSVDSLLSAFVEAQLITEAEEILASKKV